MVGGEGMICAPVDSCLRLTSPEDPAARLTTSVEHGASTRGEARLLETGNVLKKKKRVQLEPTEAQTRRHPQKLE